LKRPSFYLNLTLYASITTPIPPVFEGYVYDARTFVPDIVVTTGGSWDVAEAIKIAVTREGVVLQPCEFLGQ
jgi:hypothetical protein